MEGAPRICRIGHVGAGETAVGVRNAPQIVLSAATHEIGVVFDERSEFGSRGELDAVLVPADLIDVLQVDPAEMDEPDPSAVDLPATVLEHGESVRQVPVGDVVDGVAHDRD